MDWEGREALEHREANDRYFGAAAEPASEFQSDMEAWGFEDGFDGIYVQGRGLAYEAGWERGNALRRLRDERRA